MSAVNWSVILPAALTALIASVIGPLILRAFGDRLAAKKDRDAGSMDFVRAELARAAQVQETMVADWRALRDRCRDLEAEVARLRPFEARVVELERAMEAMRKAGKD